MNGGPVRTGAVGSRFKITKITGRMVFIGLLGFFGVVFAINGFMVDKALSTFDGLDTESSYRSGQLFPHEIAKAKAQDARHWRVDANVTPTADDTALLDIVARNSAGVALAGMKAKVTLERPTDKRLDHVAAVSEVGPGHFRGNAENVAAGQWDLIIELSRHGKRQFRSRNRIVLR